MRRAWHVHRPAGKTQGAIGCVSAGVRARSRCSQSPMLRFFADQICKLNCPAKDAVRLVRKWHHSVLWQISLAPLEGRRVDIQLFAYQARNGEYEPPKDWRRALRELRSLVRRKG